MQANRQVHRRINKHINKQLKKPHGTNTKLKYNLKNNVQAPIEKGQTIGTLDIISNNEVVIVADLVALNTVEAKGFIGRLW